MHTPGRRCPRGGRRRWAIGAIALTLALAGLAGLPTPAPALNNGLALTPPMGFNNWNFTHCDNGQPTEAMIKGIADAMVSSGMRDAGYSFVNIDDCWALPNRDGAGNLVPNPTSFPGGMPALASYVHARGLKLGIYLDAGTRTCNGARGFPGSLGHEQQDANLIASWGIDYLKYDNCNDKAVPATQRDAAMRDALAATGRPIVYSLSEWGTNRPQDWAPATGNLWRTTGDISANWASITSRLDTNAQVAWAAGRGAWNDPDMLQVGNGSMTDAEYRAHFSMWAIMAAPLLAGNDLRGMSAATRTVLTNTEVVAVDQDPAGIQGVKVAEPAAGLQVWSKKLQAAGQRAVALFNRTGASASITANWSDLGLAPGSATVRDLWAHADRGGFTNSFTATVPSHAVVMLRVAGGDPPAPSGSPFLSDLLPVHKDNGFGPYERDRSNGEAAAGDGRTLTLNGATFAKGLGVHAPSDLRFRLGGACSSFTASVGLDDEVTQGSVAFRVYADGALLFDSGTMGATTATRSVNVNVAGRSELRLVVTDAADNKNFDHADWANARLTCGGGGGPVSYEGEAAGNTFSGTAAPGSCPACSGGSKVRFIGNGGANHVTVNNVTAATAGSRALTIHYTLDGSRSFFVSVNGGAAVEVPLTGTSWSTPVTASITVTLNAGANTVRFLNNGAFAPDLDRIVV
jgi:alpha-galactosidase